MRVEPFTINSYVHVIKRGARGMEIVRGDSDKWRFLKSLYYLNNNNSRTIDWENELYQNKIPLFGWPDKWPKRDKLIEILAFMLMPNHFHLLLREIREGGISLFMQGLGASMTLHFNDKYKEKGSIFQGAYKGKLIDSDEYLRQVAVYIMVKNSFELSPDGLEKAIKNFDAAWEWGLKYQFSSLADYGSNRKSPILDKELLGEIFRTPKEFKNFAKDTILGRKLDEYQV